jgi:dCMP deaminase
MYKGEQVMERVSKTNYYLDIAQAVARRSTCLRLKYGAIIVKDDSIVSTGYNGAPRGRANCSDLGSCTRADLNIPHGQRYELCRSVHAEQNAIIAASREEMIGATLYLVGLSAKDESLVSGCDSCMMCKRFVINSGIARVIIRDTETEYRVVEVADWVKNDDLNTVK